MAKLRVKLWLVAVTVRLTVVEFEPLVLVPVTVMVCGPEGSAMLAVVVMVKVSVLGSAGLPSSWTLPPLLKLQLAPAGRPVQLELVKLTAWLKPLAGVRVRVETAL